MISAAILRIETSSIETASQPAARHYQRRHPAERSADPFDTILPAQFFGRRRDSAEWNLLVAIVTSAIHDYLGFGTDPASNLPAAVLRDNAARWFDGHPGAPISFARCCLLLDLHREVTRASIEGLKERLERFGLCEENARIIGIVRDCQRSRLGRRHRKR